MLWRGARTLFVLLLAAALLTGCGLNPATPAVMTGSITAVTGARPGVSATGARPAATPAAVRLAPATQQGAAAPPGATPATPAAFQAATAPGLTSSLSAVSSSATPRTTAPPTATPAFVASQDPNPLQINVMRQKSYPGSAITFERTLAPGPNYDQYVVSYRSDGYKIYALMTIPLGSRPADGWPVIIFNHGYIPPAQYVTTERYVAYVAAIASSGYIVFKPDYRGHGRSQGPTTGGGYGAPGYTDDVLNALASLQAYPAADPDRIGMWGHSMGGSITLRAMVVSKAVKAGVIWAGAVGPYPDVFALGTAPYAARSPGETVPDGPLGWRQRLTAEYGTPAQNPRFWASISPNSYLAGISGPLQLHHSLTDPEISVAASRLLYQELRAAGKPAELYMYPKDDHNLSANFVTAMQRSIAFFDKYVKGP